MNDWRQQAACRTYNTDLWFPGPQDDDKRAFAKSICAQCPVRRECLDEALANNERYGVWGGVSIASYLREERRRGRHPRAQSDTVGALAPHLRIVSCTSRTVA